MMNYKKFLKIGFVSLLGLGNLSASSSSTVSAPAQEDSSKLLIIGCRPWDKDLKDVKGLEKASFIDFMLEMDAETKAPSPLPTNFFHVDLNDEKMYGSKSFSAFVENHREAFDTIVIDWATAQHIKDWKAWPKMRALLSNRGTLVIPLFFHSMNTNLVSSATLLDQNVTKMTEELTSKVSRFSSVKRYKGTELSADVAYNLLRREKALEYLNAPNSAILIATK